MTINEAVKEALATGGTMIRRQEPIFLHMSIKPGEVTCAIIEGLKTKTSKPGWEPSSEDLMADDWCVLLD